MYKRILVPVDLDHTDKLTKALDLAGRMAKDNDASVVYVDVVDAVPTTSPVPEGRRVADRLDKFAKAEAARHGITVDQRVPLRSDLRLNVGPDVIKTAEETGCDVIVMASHMPGFKDHILTSNAAYVAAHAPMSVFVVR